MTIRNKLPLWAAVSGLALGSFAFAQEQSPTDRAPDRDRDQAQVQDDADTPRQDGGMQGDPKAPQLDRDDRARDRGAADRADTDADTPRQDGGMQGDPKAPQLDRNDRNDRADLDADADMDADIDRDTADVARDTDRKHMTDKSATLTQLRELKGDPMAADKLFVLHSAMGNLWEVRFSELVQQRSQDQQVKDTAQRILNDHQQANQRLQQIARDMNLKLPTQLSAEKQALLDIYRDMPVEQLETCYILEQKALHAKDVTSFADHARTVKHDGLRQYVTETLPRLRAHTQNISAVAEAKGISGNFDIETAGAETGEIDPR